ncbi:MAG: hypothetical protein NZ561_10330 [Phycisphaerae bacterium]|nr:hypothetical protein [Phycisphaerae bacterium]MDW8261355.1 hypothetical protein [Phycisphaerales bacterium]
MIDSNRIARAGFWRAMLLLMAIASAARGGEPLVHHPDRDPVIGVNLWSVYAGPMGIPAWQQQVRRIHAMGFGGLTILPQLFVDLRTGEVSPDDPTPNPTFGGMTDQELTAAVQEAKSLGLLVTVSPTLEAANRSIFRGFIAFNDEPARDDNGLDLPQIEDRFWTSYTAQIVRLARVAQLAGADRFNIGAELGALDTDRRNQPRWQALIASADAVFQGELGYTTTHWTFDRPETARMIWADPRIDYIGLSAYFPLASAEESFRSHEIGREAFVQIVQRNFAQALDRRILKLAEQTGKNVVLSEVGITPFDGAASAPWNWQQGDAARYDPDEAEWALEGVLRALAGRKGRISAVHLWTWGWPGGFAGERFYISDNLEDLPSTALDESKMAPANRLLRAYLKSQAR